MYMDNLKLEEDINIKRDHPGHPEFFYTAQSIGLKDPIWVPGIRFNLTPDKEVCHMAQNIYRMFGDWGYDNPHSFMLTIKITDRQTCSGQPPIPVMGPLTVNEWDPEDYDINDTYEIELNDQEKDALYASINGDCILKYGLSCEELLTESRKVMLGEPDMITRREYEEECIE